MPCLGFYRNGLAQDPTRMTQDFIDGDRLQAFKPTDTRVRQARRAVRLFVQDDALRTQRPPSSRAKARLMTAENRNDRRFNSGRQMDRPRIIGHHKATTTKKARQLAEIQLTRKIHRPLAN